jgi:peptide/nickel transport system substrate-binding protein
MILNRVFQFRARHLFRSAVCLTVLLLLTSQVYRLDAQSSPANELVILQPVEFTSFDPNTVSAQPTTNIAHNVLETLVERDQKTPLLAESWKTLDDLTWQFSLRKGVQFTNGEPFNADVVKFSIERVLREKNENSSARALFASVIDKVNVVDELTVNIVTKQPFASLLDLIIDAYMLPPKVADTPDFSSKAVGTGPYVVDSWKVGEAMVLAANPNYWGEKPFFARVTFRPVAEPAVRSSELRTQKADIITQIPIEELGRLKEPGLQVVRILSTQSMRIHLKADAPPFNDARVRQAMNYAIDRKTILETLLENAGQLMNGPTSPSIFGYDSSIEVYPYDPDKARKLLADAGHTNGVDVVIQFTDGRYTRDRAIGEAIVAQLAEVGIRVQPKFSEFSQWLKIFNKEGHGFMVIAQETNPNTLMGPNFGSSSQSFKRYGYANPEVDKLINEASKTLDTAKREALYKQLNRLLHDDAPWVYMWNPEDIYAIRDTIVGFEPNGVGYFYVKDLSRK